MNVWFLITGIVTLLLCLLHIVGGGKIAARPLLASKTMGSVAKYTNYYCWHMVTIIIATMGGMFIWAAYHAQAVELAVVATGLAFAFMLWSFGIVAINKWRFMDFPQWLLFGAIFGLSILGFL